jgi:hypothetical protein
LKKSFLIYALILLASCGDSLEKENAELPPTPEPPPDSAVYVTVSGIPQDRVDPNDATWLRIRALKKGYEFSLLGQHFISTSPMLIDSFISVNRTKIYPKKILVSTELRLPDSRFDKMLDILKQLGIVRFKMITDSI